MTKLNKKLNKPPGTPIRKAFGIELEKDPLDKSGMTESGMQVYVDWMEELQTEWEENSETHKLRRFVNRGIRSSQMSALVSLLIKKGILK